MGWGIAFLVGVLLGVAIGRWRALVAAVAFAAYIASASDIETPPGPVYLAFLAMLVAASGIAIGIVLRRAGHRRL